MPLRWTATRAEAKAAKTAEADDAIYMLQSCARLEKIRDEMIANFGRTGQQPPTGQDNPTHHPAGQDSRHS